MAVTHADPDRNPVEQLAEEYVERFRRGERPSIQEYLERYPEHAGEISELFPAAMMIEKLKPRSTSVSGGLVDPFGPGQSRPKQLGDFRILGEVGRGGMGIVYEAEQESLGRRVALKVLPCGSLKDPRRLRRFQREAQTAAQLHHTNIVPVFGVGEQDGLHYYVMQFIQGEGLDDVLHRLNCSSNEVDMGTNRNAACLNTPRNGSQATAAGAGPSERPGSSSTSVVEDKPRLTRSKSTRRPRHESARETSHGAWLPRALNTPHTRDYWNAVASIGIQVGEALEYAHSQGTVHRDIKPANLLVDPHGIVWVTDFGLAKLHEQEDITKSGDVVGTLRYIAPEQFEGNADSRSDIYSLGLTLYELLTLRPAYNEPGGGQLLRQLTQQAPPNPRKLDRRIPVDLETIVLKAISHDPNDRYQSAGELATDLQQFLEDRPIFARRASVSERLARWCRRNQTVATLLAIAAVSLLLATVVGWRGYVTTTAALERESQRRGEAERATQKAEENVALSLKAFEQIFDQMAGEDRSPVVGREIGGLSPGPARPPVQSQEDAALLESILQFYDHFAEKNSTNLGLQAEAAKAHRRVGDIQQRLGQLDKAELAYDRAADIYDRLIEAFPMDAGYRDQLAELCTLAEPYSTSPEVLDRAFRRYGRGLSIAEKLATESPDSWRYQRTLAKSHDRLGHVLQLMKRNDEAEEHFRQSLKIHDRLVVLRPDDFAEIVHRSLSRHALGRILLERNAPAEARLLFESAIEDIQTGRGADLPAGAATPGPPVNPEWLLAAEYQSLADALKQLKEVTRADEATQKAAELQSALNAAQPSPPPIRPDRPR